jgi:integrase/recombinase XerD
MLQKAGIEKKISPHKLRHTYAANLLNVGVELVETQALQALLGHSTLNTTPIDAHVDQNRMEAW